MTAKLEGSLQLHSGRFCCLHAGLKCQQDVYDSLMCTLYGRKQKVWHHPNAVHKTAQSSVGFWQCRLLVSHCLLLAVAGCGASPTRSIGHTFVRHPLMMGLPTFGQGGASRSGQAKSGCLAVRPLQASASVRRTSMRLRWRPQTAARMSTTLET